MVARTGSENEIAALRQEVAELKKLVGEMQGSISDLVAAWRAGSLVLNVVKWSAGLASAVAIVWTTLHGGTPR